MKTNLFLILGVFSVIFFATFCYKPEVVLNQEKIKSSENQGIVYQEEKVTWQKIYFQAIEKRIKGTDIGNLKDLEISPNSKEIRIWIGFSTLPLKGFILRNNNNEWSALYLQPIDENSDLSRNPKLLLPPKSGWDKLSKKLEQLQIDTITDSGDIALMDEESVVIEVKTSTDYRTYKYSGVKATKGDNYKKVLEICDTLSDEFGNKLF